MKRECNEEFEIGRRRGVRCTARRLDVCGRKVDGGLEARRAVLPRARRKQEEGGAGGRIFFARSRVAPKHWSLASSLCVASAFCDSEKRTTLSMSGSGHRGVLHAISKSNAPQLLNYCRHSRRNRRRRENARLRVFPQENSCLIFLVDKTSIRKSRETRNWSIGRLFCVAPESPESFCMSHCHPSIYGRSQHQP